MVGDIVHFKIGKGVVRPMLVISQSGSVVDVGLLFLDWESDRVTEWCREKLFDASFNRDLVQVFRVQEGEGVGEWSPRLQPIPSQRKK